MYIVTVLFEVEPQHVEAFRTAMREQAQNSLQRETGCRQFDVCFDAQRTELCFLYEKYDDREAFETHLASQHFEAFDATVRPWIRRKEVQTWCQAADSPIPSPPTAELDGRS